MIIRRLAEVQASGRHIFGRNKTWDSARYILADDGVGFSFHITTLYQGQEIPLWYKNHVEAVYIISGQLAIKWTHEDETPQSQILGPGDMYLLDQNDRHVLRPMGFGAKVACVFNPPVTGTEDHDADGSYELAPEQDTVTITRERYKELLRAEEEAGNW